MLTPSIPILAYHKIDDRPDFGITSRKIAHFKEDLRLLEARGYHSITFKDLDAGISVPEKAVIITFDDGYASFHDLALPLLLERGFRAVVFIPTAYVGRENSWDVQWGQHHYQHMDVEQIVACHRAGIEIGSHLVQHLFPGLLSDAVLEYEMAASKKQLSEWTNEEVISLSYPFGKYDPRAIRAARGHYRYAVGQSSPAFPGEELSALFLPRINVYRMDSSARIIKKMEQAVQGRFSIRDRLIQKGAWATVALQYLKFSQKNVRKIKRHAEIN